MKPETESKLKSLFAAHNEAEAAKKKAAGAAAAQRDTMVRQSIFHLTKVVTPELRRLAATFKEQGQDASVDVQQSSDGEPSWMMVKFLVTPAGHAGMSDSALPWLTFHASGSGIATHVHAMFPGKGGSSEDGQLHVEPATLTAEKVEAEVVSLIERTYGL